MNWRPPARMHLRSLAAWAQSASKRLRAPHAPLGNLCTSAPKMACSPIATLDPKEKAMNLPRLQTVSASPVRMTSPGVLDRLSTHVQSLGLPARGFKLTGAGAATALLHEKLGTVLPRGQETSYFTVYLAETVSRAELKKLPATFASDGGNQYPVLITSFRETAAAPGTMTPVMHRFVSNLDVTVTQAEVRARWALENS